jgi:pentatricopeptide repeat protein
MRGITTLAITNLAARYLRVSLTGEMRGKNLPVELATYNALLNVCAGAGDTARANEVLDTLATH